MLYNYQSCILYHYQSSRYDPSQLEDMYKLTQYNDNIINLIKTFSLQFFPFFVVVVFTEKGIVFSVPLPRSTSQQFPPEISAASGPGVKGGGSAAIDNFIYLFIKCTYTG